MMKRLAIDRYHDDPYQSGRHVVLLCLPDSLQDVAERSFERVSAIMPTTTFWSAVITSDDEAEVVEAVRYPQYRFLCNGSEQSVHVGLLDDDRLLDCLDHLES